MAENTKWKLTTFVSIIAVFANLATFVWAASSFRESVTIRLKHVEIEQNDHEERLRLVEKGLPRIYNDLSWIKGSLERLENAK